MYLPKLVLVPKRLVGVQMDLSSSDLPAEYQKFVKEKLREEKIENYSVNYVVELNDNKIDTNKDFTGTKLRKANQKI